VGLSLLGPCQLAPCCPTLGSLWTVSRSRALLHTFSLISMLVHAPPTANAALHTLRSLCPDHYAGLSQSWKEGPVYCSETTAQFIGFHFPVLLETGLIHTLSLGRSPHTLRFSKSMTASVLRFEGKPLGGVHFNHDLCSGEGGAVDEVKVWLVDAGHCPGSVMFLFEGTFGVYFHTGALCAPWSLPGCSWQ